MICLYFQHHFSLVGGEAAGEVGVQDGVALLMVRETFYAEIDQVIRGSSHHHLPGSWWKIFTGALQFGQISLC